MKKKIVYIILGFSLLLNALYFKYDTIDYLWPKVEKKYFKPKLIDTTDYIKAEKRIVASSLKMLASEEAVMVWDEGYGLTNKILSLRSTRSSKDFQQFNFPKAFLSLGLINLITEKKDKLLINNFEEIFSSIIDDKGNPKFQLNKVDQVPFGLAALKLYHINKENKYLIFSKHIIAYLQAQINSNGIIYYRTGSNYYYYDTLGMIVHFLLEYSRAVNDDSYLNIAREQIDFFIKNNGINPNTYVPHHGVILEKNIPIGSSNWGRGIGWYYMALAHYYKETGEFEEEYLGLTNTINNLKNTEGLWSQFPGSGNQFDASTSTMFLYGQTLLNPERYTKQEILSMFANHINEEGEILQTSGDTYAVNRYSATFGKSELSQGMLLLLLANAQK